MTVLLNIVLPVFLVAGLAALIHRSLELDLRSFSRAAFYVFSPALVFDLIANSNVGGLEFFQIAVSLLLITAVLWGVGAGAARVLRLDGPTRGALLISLLLMNAGNFGLPVILFAFGEPGMARATVYFVVSTMITSSLGVFLAARGRLTTGAALRRMIGVPLAYGAALGLLVNFFNIPVPEPLTKSIHLLGQASVPTYLVVLGIQLTRAFESRGEQNHWPALSVVVVGRLILAPLLGLGIARLMGLGSPTWEAVVVESAMPTAVMSTVLAHEFETVPPFVTRAVLLTTLLSLLTLTVLLNILL